MVEQQKATDLNERSCRVLEALIREYVRVGKPVGSRRLSRVSSERLSPATLRNVMSNLEKAGFLSQPHTSAGRVPTQRGYQFYVESLLKTRKLSADATEEIKKSLEHESDPEELMNRTSQLLSAYSNSIGIVLSPPISQLVMKHIEFIKLSKYRVLVVLVGKADLVQHRWIRLEEAFSQAELDQAGRYLVENFRGKNLTEIRWELLKLMRKEKALYNRLLKTVTLLGSAAVVQSEEDSSEDSQVYLGGTARVISRLGLAEVDRLVSLLQTFEEKSRLVRIITECLKSQQESPTVTVGLEDHIPGMGNWSLITSPYNFDQSTVGSLGILGPSRMEYEKAISLVDYVARLFGEILRSNLGRDPSR